jgi:hypothetical protein
MKIKTGSFLHLFVLLLCVAILFYLPSCDRSDAEGDPVPLTIGDVRDKGVALGDQEQFTIEASGGEIISADGAITLKFPEGAVAGTTTVTIQKIDNTSPNGLGNAFRLGPHETFKAPVTLVIKYTLDSVSFVEGVGVAFQNDKGIWNAVEVLAHDRNAQTISIETLHFSDWSVFQSVKISPSLSVIKPGDEVTLTATAVLKGEDLLTPLVGQPKPLGTRPIDEAYISSWSLEGPGSLSSSGNTAKYKAGKDFKSEVAEVHLSLNVDGAPTSVANATILTGGSSVTFAGGPYGSGYTVHGFASGIYEASNNTTVIAFKGASSEGDFSVVLSFNGKGPGTFPWSAEKDKESAVMSEHNYPGGSHVGTFAALGKDNGHHPGSITIDAIQPPGKFIFGSFQGGYTYMREHCVECMTEGSISGTFIAKRYR